MQQLGSWGQKPTHVHYAFLYPHSTHVSTHVLLFYFSHCGKICFGFKNMPPLSILVRCVWQEEITSICVYMHLVKGFLLETRIWARFSTLAENTRSVKESLIAVLKWWPFKGQGVQSVVPACDGPRSHESLLVWCPCGADSWLWTTTHCTHIESYVIPLNMPPDCVGGCLWMFLFLFLQM